MNGFSPDGFSNEQLTKRRAHPPCRLPELRSAGMEQTACPKKPTSRQEWRRPASARCRRPCSHPTRRS